MDVPLAVLGSYFHINQTQFSATANPAVQILNPDPSRWCLTFSSFSSGTFIVGNFSDLVNNPGIVINPGTNPVDIFFDRHGAWCQLAWWIFTSAGTAACSIIETLYRPPPGA